MKIKYILIQFIMLMCAPQSGNCFEKNYEALNPQFESPVKGKLDNFYDVIDSFFSKELHEGSPRKHYPDSYESLEPYVQNIDETSRKRKREALPVAPNKVRRTLEYTGDETHPDTPTSLSSETPSHQSFEYYTSPISDADYNMPQVENDSHYSSLSNSTYLSTDYTTYLNTAISDTDKTLLTTYLQPAPTKVIQESDLPLPPVNDTNITYYIDQIIEIRKKNHPKKCCSQKYGSWPTLVEHIKSKHASDRGFDCPECKQHTNCRANLLAELFATHAHTKFLSCPRCKKNQSAGNLKNHFLKCGIIKNQIKTPKPMFQSFKMYQPK